MKGQLFSILLFGFLLCSLSGYSQRIQPEDLQYLGAFRLPDVAGDVTWEYSGTAMTCDPRGDPTGPNDGFPGSLFIVGHDWYQQVAEVSIPRPVISAARNPKELNTATMLQPFGDIRDGLFSELEMPTVGLTLLPDTSGATRGTLYFCWGQHFQFHEPTHGFCSLDLFDPQPAGPFHFGTANNYTTCDYMFTLPDDWAAAHTQGQNLATGRFREGHWSGLGPALYAFSPFAPGQQPAAGDTITAITPLLLYGEDDPALPEIVIDESRKMNGFSPSDQWSGASWISAGDKAAVIFAGTKAMGNAWYGFSDGTVWPDEPPYPPVPDPPHDNRGWWCDSIRAQIIFYDPADLAAVAEGRLQPWEPQPYATLDINDVLFDPGFDYPRYKRWSLGAICADNEHGFLYVIERRADEEKSLVHVWQIRDTGTGVKGDARTLPEHFSLHQNYPNPFNPTTTICYQLPEAAEVSLILYDLTGKKVAEIDRGHREAGVHKATFSAQGLASGIYLYRLTTGSGFVQTRKLMVLK